MKTRKEKKSKKVYIVLTAVVVILVLFALTAALKIENVTYEGNVRLSEEELNGHIFGESFDSNPFVFIMKNKFGDKQEIPFVEDYEVEMNSLTSIKITVYEKSIVGYVSYMGTYMYFDKDGIVVENSLSEYEDIPEITGMHFDNIILYSKIPTENERIFDIILDITQLVDKYKIAVKRINISETMNVTLYINSFRVALGNNGSYGEKVAALADILPNMKDIPGELDMKEYNVSNTGYVFKKD